MMSVEYPIMLVDDDTDLLFLLKRQLEKAGFGASICLRGIGLIKKLLEKKIRLVLMDISMGTVSGDRLCKVVKADKRTSGIKVLMMSADADIRQIAANCGADGFITKPVDMNKVKQLVADLISNSRNT